MFWPYPGDYLCLGIGGYPFVGESTCGLLGMGLREGGGVLEVGCAKWEIVGIYRASGFVVMVL